MDKKTISAELKKLGLKKGSIVMLHSSYLSLGPVEGGPEAVVDAFLDAIGPKGTLMVPIFGALGVITDIVKSRKDAVLDDCPVGRVACIGPKAQELVAEHWKADTAHGENTPFTRLEQLGGYICLLGCDQDRNTTLHSIEAILQLPYLSDTSATFTTADGKKVSKTWKYYPGPHRNFIGIDHYMLHEGLMTIGRIGNAQVRLMKASDLFDLCLELGEHDKAWALCENPACEDCVLQRAKIFAAEMSEESFKLSISSRLAGRYVPEIIENMKKIGLKYVELDYLQGKACAKMTSAALGKAVAEFAESGIEISALRVFFMPEDSGKLVALAKEAGISRIILPLGSPVWEADGAVSVEYANCGQESPLAASLLPKGGAAVFNPPAFVRAGEHPFLYSYKAGRYIKSASQLDMSDATWDGGAARLAYGNGEVKELLSIFRCRNFSGFVCLGGGAAYPGDAAEAANDFASLLASM